MKNQKSVKSADLLIVLALLAIICTLLFRKPIEKMVSELFLGTEVTYTVQFYGNLDPSFKKGSEVFNAKGTCIGTIQKVAYLGKDSDTGETPTVLTITADGLKNPTGTYVGESMFIAPGLNMEIRSDKQMSAYCVVKKVQTAQ